jgi:hypothetical protein
MSTLGLILLVILFLFLLGAIPRTGAYSEGWGPWPGGIIGLILVVVLILVLLGRI